jgi:tetratricopeptide (TPR) repeat protein
MKAVCIIDMAIWIWCWTMPATRSLLWMLLASAVLASNMRDMGIQDFQHGRFSEALAKLKQAVRNDPSDARARLYLALTQAASNDCKSALPELTAAAKLSPGALARLGGLAAAKCLQSIGDNAAALTILEQLERQFTNDPDVLYSLARFHMKAFNDTTLAMFQRTPASYRVHQLSAEIFEIEGRYDQAIAEYQKAIAINPAAPDIHFRLGRAFLMTGHGDAALAQARTEFTAELTISPEDAACEFQLGQIAQAQNRLDEARLHFVRATTLSPEFPEALVALARLHSGAKQFDQAISLLERAVRLQPANEAAHYALMMAYRNSGQMEKARAEKMTVDRLQKPPEGEFTEFLRKLGEKPPQP